jgi:anti-sigma factor ChrR (cupin superfamily)
MNDEELRLAYRRASKGAAPGPHPEPEQLERIVNGKGSEAERLVLLEHVLRCPSCGPELDLIRAAGEGASAAERRAPAARWLALAAAAILVIGLGTLALRGRRTVASDDVLRGRAHAMSLIEPESGARLALPIQLAWHAVDGAASYRVELLSTTGDLIGAWTTRDTTLAIADSAHVSASHSYDVWVRATLKDRTDQSSPIVRFNEKR